MGMAAFTTVRVWEQQRVSWGASLRSERSGCPSQWSSNMGTEREKETRKGNGGVNQDTGIFERHLMSVRLRSIMIHFVGRTGGLR